MAEAEEKLKCFYRTSRCVTEGLTNKKRNRREGPFFWKTRARSQLKRPKVSKGV